MFLRPAGLSVTHAASTNPTKWHHIRKKGKDFLYDQRRGLYDRKPNGCGRQTEPVFQNKAKIVKKTVLKSECVEPNCRSKRDVNILKWEELRN